MIYIIKSFLEMIFWLFVSDINSFLVIKWTENISIMVYIYLNLALIKFRGPSFMYLEMLFYPINFLKEFIVHYLDIFKIEWP